MTTAREWTESISLPDGHRIFHALGGGFARWAVADNSGQFPENTDDGVLWLDTIRPINVVKNNNGSGEYVLLVPVKNDAGEESAFVTDVRTMFTLADKFAWAIEAKDALYVVQAIS